MFTTAAVVRMPACFHQLSCSLLAYVVPRMRVQVAEISTLFDDDGILVRFMNSNTEGNAVRCVPPAAADGDAVCMTCRMLLSNSCPQTKQSNAASWDSLYAELVSCTCHV